jgi:hypothetical protein
VKGLADPAVLASVVSGLNEAWKFLEPYALGKDIETIEELKEYQRYLLQYWSTMNSGVWEALAEPGVRDEAKNAFVTRTRTDGEIF